MKRRIVWINITLAGVLVAALVGGYVWLFRDATEASTGRTVAVQSGSVSETVTATGSVETAGTVDLSFTQGGTVISVLVEAGDTVESGQRLAILDDTSAQQALTEAARTYAQATASARQSSVSVSGAQRSLADAQQAAAMNKESYAAAVAQAKTALADAKASWSASCLDPNGSCPSTEAWSQLRAAEGAVVTAKAAYDQAVQTASTDETTNNLKINQAKVNAEAAQSRQYNDCNTYGSTSSQCTSANDSVRSSQQAYENALNTQRVAAVQSQQNLANADAQVTSANVALRRLQSSLAESAQDARDSAEQSLASARLAQRKGVAADQQSISQARESLASLQAGSAAVDTGAGTTTPQDAAVAVARDGIASARQSIEDAVLRAPVAGTVGSVAVDADQVAAAGSPVLTLIPEASFEVVADFSEADASKVAAGQSATVTFDALSGESASGAVTSVAVLPTTGGTVTTYAATITLSGAPAGMRDGMSASVVVTVDEATGVLWAPSAAITTAGGVSTVTVRTDGVDTVVPVTTGLAGDSGTQITSGVSEGDQLVVATADSGGGFTGFPGGGPPVGLGGGAGIPGGGGN
ncbi:MAG: HlyD family efflux transporter periplasmic adaptor subunit [Actinomycetota bacterium]|nr:HlyD family efflux transporter periplasmic adaptor subunit [Actinomycetota bacterium]